MKFYSLKPILKKNCRYNIIIGERSNGKTYSVLKYALEKFVKDGKQLAILRRWREDFTGKRGNVLWDALIANKEVEKATKGEWTQIFYQASKWYLGRFDEEGKKVYNEKPLAYGFALTEVEHDKSTSYPDIELILFDEFISRMGYLNDEFSLFTNTLSTIIRQRDTVTIFMCGNTVNKYNPYIKEMGLKHVSEMKQGSIDVYTYGDSGLRVAVEYCSPVSKDGKPSDVYFAFDNSALKMNMITKGSWEMDIYPHLYGVKYKPKEILFYFFIIFEENILQCEVISTEDGKNFILIHKKTTELKTPDKDLIYSLDFDPRPNWKRNILKPTSNLENKILHYFKSDKIFYDSNETGEIVMNYLKCCK